MHHIYYFAALVKHQESIIFPIIRVIYHCQQRPITRTVNDEQVGDRHIKLRAIRSIDHWWLIILLLMIDNIYIPIAIKDLEWLLHTTTIMLHGRELLPPLTWTTVRQTTPFLRSYHNCQVSSTWIKDNYSYIACMAANYIACWNI